MFLIVLGGLLVAIGVALFSVPLGVVTLGLELVATGVYQDLTTDGDTPEPAP